MKYFTKKIFLFIAIFTVVGFIALQIPITQVVGSKTKFTLYDAFAPIAGSFIGNIPGIIAVFLMQFFNFLIHGASSIKDPATIIRFFPMLFAVFYFARKGVSNLVIPIMAIAGFIIHPIGRQVWYYSLFWIIPFTAYFFRDKFLFARALGSTFTAHAVGSTLWIWAFALPAPIWQSLIPVTIIERLLFTIGISSSFILVNNVLAFLEKQQIFNLGFRLEQKYLIPFLRQHQITKTAT